MRPELLWCKIQLLVRFKNQDGGERHLKNTQTGVSRPILDRFTPNLICSFIVAIEGPQVPKIAFVGNSKGGRRHLVFCFFGHISVTNEGISSNLVCTQMLPYGSTAKITLFVKFMMLAIWTKFGTPIQNEMQTWQSESTNRNQKQNSNMQAMGQIPRFTEHISCNYCYLFDTNETDTQYKHIAWWPAHMLLHDLDLWPQNCTGQLHMPLGIFLFFAHACRKICCYIIYF